MFEKLLIIIVHNLPFSKVIQSLYLAYHSKIIECWHLAYHITLNSQAKQEYRIFPAIRRGFRPSRMTSNNLISPMKFCYNTNSTLPKQCQSSRSVLQDGSRTFGLFWKEKTLSYNRRNTVPLIAHYCSPPTPTHRHNTHTYLNLDHSVDFYILILLQITETLEGVEVIEDGALHIYKEEKMCRHSWSFTVRSKV